MGLKIFYIFGLLVVLTITVTIYNHWYVSYLPNFQTVNVQDDKNIYHGAVRNLGHPQFCLDSLYNKRKHNEIGVRHCPLNINDPPENQRWALTQLQYLRRPKGGCLEGTRWGLVQITACKENNNRLKWTYEPTVNLIIEKFSSKCLEIDPKEQKVYLMKCDAAEQKQKWEFTYHNTAELVEFTEYTEISREITLSYA